MTEIRNNIQINDFFSENTHYCRKIIEEKQEKLQELQKELRNNGSFMTKIERKKIQLDMKQTEKHITHYKKLLYSIWNKWR